MRSLLVSPYLIAIALAPLVSCTADDPVERNKKPDASVGEPLAPPEVTVPEATPEAAVAVRGTTEGSRVVIHSSANNPISSTVLPGGAFCKDIPLAENETNPLTVYALGGDGRVSVPAEIKVLHDPSAPAPAEPTCSGSSSTCDPAETCDSGRDDDCDGKADFCDLECNGCAEDTLAPNHRPEDVPSVQPDTYDLKICPCHDDWFAFNVGAGGTINVSANFSTDEIDLDLTLHPAGPEGVGAGAAVAQSTGSENSEAIQYTSEAAGLYYLRAFAYPEEAKGSGSYQLTIN